MTAEEIQRRIREIKTLTSKPFGVDLLLPVSLADAKNSRAEVRKQLQNEYPDYVNFVERLKREFEIPDMETETDFVLTAQSIRDQVQVVLDENVPVFAAGLGDPSWVVPLAREKSITVMGLVGTVRHAVRQVEAGVDIVVSQGYEAGGHTGRIANFPLIPQVVDAVDPVPVIAGGGIADGRGIAAALSLGAIGAWIGTAFLAASESWIPKMHQEQIVSGRSEDFVVTRAYTGKTARDYKNLIIDAWEKSDLAPLPMPLQEILMADLVRGAEKIGKHDLVNNPAGQIGGLIKELRPAAEIMDDLVAGTVRVLDGLP